MPNLAFERASGHSIICGIDEAGRGPWAGSVCAAAVILDRSNIPPGLDDSKKLNEANREALYPLILAKADVGIGLASAQEIDELNILQATYLAMRRAFESLKTRPALALIDGNRAPKIACATQTIIGGDGKSLSIAAASIIAKVTRDRLMYELDKTYPAYGFAKHKGYGTTAHHAALKANGPCPQHRFSFKPIAALTLKPNLDSQAESKDS